MRSNVNTGVWERFIIAASLDVDYFWVLDDDTIPGSCFLQRCLYEYTKNPGIYSAFGFKFKTPSLSLSNWNERSFYGWPAPLKETTRVDWPGHSWFFDRKVLFEFLKLSDNRRYNTCGEDACLAVAGQRVGQHCWVPAWEKREECGSLFGRSLGEDKHATYKVKGQRRNMLETLTAFRNNLGWKWIVEE